MKALKVYLLIFQLTSKSKCYSKSFSRQCLLKYYSILFGKSPDSQACLSLKALTSTDAILLESTLIHPKKPSGGILDLFGQRYTNFENILFGHPN